jgi:signal recognition particle subunit SRP54
LVATLGGQTGKLTMSPKPPTVVMLAGLQGSGKTTAAGKLARLLKSQGLQPLLVGADLQRPAAVEQLRVLARRVDVPFYSEPSDPIAVARNAIEEAARLGRNIVIVDTAGRLQIDAELMDELRHIRDAVQPHDTLLVVDAMTGQEAVNVAESFNDTIGLDGVILTKIDGDARGGAALSVKEVTGKPILFAGTGEKLEDFEPFHPDRMASRILGMGDVLTLIEKAEAAYDVEQRQRAEEIVREGTFTLDDFLDQMQQVKKMGPLQNVLGMMPGMPKELKNADIDEGELAKVEAIIRSMTPYERRKPDVINGSRRSRIARGSGVKPSDVSGLLKQFKQMQQMMRGFAPMMRRKGKKGKRARETTAKRP